VKRFSLLATAVLMSALFPAAAAAKPVVSMSGSTSVAPLAIKLVRAYLKTHSKKAAITFKLAQGGSDIGVADVAAGRVTIGNASRDPKATDPGGIQFNPIARDAVCLVTSPGNSLANVDQATVKAIFSGQVQDWSEVPGSPISGPIDVIVRTAPSGTQDAFQKLFMGSTTVKSSAAAKASNGLVQQAVKTDKGGIGYVSLAFTQGVNPVAYQGVGCTLRDAKAGTYPAVRTFYMVTRGAPTGPAARWINWIQHSPAADKIIATDWVPLH
jgi:phosphate transport system substrate-binding protein